MKPGIKNWFKRKKTDPVKENFTCQNCETVFSGRFCPECGQSVKDFDRPISFIFYNFVGDFFAFDSRFYRSFTALLFRPGYLSLQYFEGKRVRYAPPFRIFIFISFILFLLLQIYTNRGLTTVLDSDFDKGKTFLDSTSLVLADSLLNQATMEMDADERAAADSALNKIGIGADSVSDKLNFKLNMETFRDTRDLRQALAAYADVLEKKLEQETDPKNRAKIREYIRLCRSPEQAMARILEYTSWAFFILLPLFALILNLVYIRRKHNYIRHLVFSVHIHSFVFLIMTLISLMYMLFKGNIELFTGVLIFSIPVYFCLALKKFYGQTWGKVILKFFATAFLYNIIFYITIVFVFLNALSIV